METKNNNIRKEVEVSALSVSKVSKSDYQKEGTLTAELKQTVTTVSYYPTKSVANSLNENIFAMADFGFEEKSFPNKETRIAWIDVPEGSTRESVVEQLKKFPEANLYRILSNKPIIADTEQHAIDNPDLPNVTIDTFANRQVVRVPEGAENAGMLALKDGKVQYRRIAFSKTAAEDVDSRNVDPADFYASPVIKAELNSTVHIPEGQSL